MKVFAEVKISARFCSDHVIACAPFWICENVESHRPRDCSANFWLPPENVAFLDRLGSGSWRLMAIAEKSVAKTATTGWSPALTELLTRENVFSLTVCWRFLPVMRWIWGCCTKSLFAIAPVGSRLLQLLVLCMEDAQLSANTLPTTHQVVVKLWEVWQKQKT